MSLSKKVSRLSVGCLVTAISFLAQASPGLAATGAWEVAGTTGFTNASANSNSIVTDDAGNIYAAFRDAGVSNKASVMKYDGTSWEYLGQRGFTDGEAYNTNLAFDNAGTLYVAYNDVSRSYKTSVSKYDGTSWQNHATGVGDTSYYQIGFDIDNANNLFIAVKNDRNRLVVQKQVRGNWTILLDDNRETDSLDLEIDRSTNTPYLVYQDRNNRSKPVVLKYASSWETVGGQFASDSSTPNVKINIDSQGVPYINYSYNMSVHVRKLNGSGWENVGPSINSASESALALGSDDVPYVVYRSSNSPYKLTGKKFNGSSWEDLGSTNFTNGNSYYVTATIGLEDAFHVFYTDAASGSKGSVMSYIVPNLPPTFEFTDPNGLMDKADTSFEIKWTDEDELDDASIALYYDDDNVDEDGTLIVENLSEDDETDSYVWDTTALADGSYYIYAILDDGKNDPVTVYSTDTVTVDHSNTATDWETVGERGFTQAETHNGSSTAVAPDGTVYFAYANYANANKLNVQKFNGSTWTIVGSADFTANIAYDIDIAVSSVGVPYVVYKDAANSNRATVQKFNGSTWEFVGPVGFSDGSTVAYIRITFDSNDVPYVIYRDVSLSNRATVKKFNGTTWETVGARGFSGDSAYRPDIAFDQNDVLYTAFTDASDTYKVIVQKFNGSDWIKVGGNDVSSSYSNEFNLAIDENNAPYVLVGDNSNSLKAVVKKFDGLDWQTVGTAGFSSGGINDANIDFDQLGNLYVGYRDQDLSGALVVQKFNGSAWENVGSVGFTNGAVSKAEMAIGTDRTIYFGFTDGSSFGNKGSVMQFIQPNSAPSITITQPDGINDSSDNLFNITWTDADLDDDASIALYYDTDTSGADGTLISANLSEDDADDNQTWNTSSLADGNYYIYAVISDGVNADVVAYSSGSVQVSHASTPPPPESSAGIFEQGVGGMYHDGNVGIGTGDALSLNERLMVSGRIRAQEIILENTGWADFVFEDDYELRSLAELSAFIAANKHLPDIPLAEDVQENGTFIGELQPKLLQKIEELTLYLLDMWKENSELRERVEALEE
jgi:hypothetical protein